MNKLKANKGETLVETLISIIIVVISVALLVTSVTAAARMNIKVKNAVSNKMAFSYEDSKVLGQGTMNVYGILNATDSIEVKIYDSNDYYYYVRESDKNGQNN